MTGQVLNQGVVSAHVDVGMVVAMVVGSFCAMTSTGRRDAAEHWAARLTDTILDVIAPPELPQE